MSRHEGVSCDACLKGNFQGRRYKCLICYDYDLCASCYEGGATTTIHTAEHAMQCMLTRVDFDLYYGGEAFSVEQPQAFTCPSCGRMGYTETSLQEHVTAEHTETSSEVICPICAALPGGDPNHSSGVRHVRRMFHPGRGLGGQRARRSNMHFTSSTSGGGTTTQTSTQSSNHNREAMDPIAELLSQLSGVRRSAGGQLSSGPSASRLQQLQLQLDRQQTQAARQQLEMSRSTSQRGSRTSTQAGLNANPNPGHHNANPGSNSFNNPSPNPVQHVSNTHTQNSNSQFLLNRLSEERLSEAELQLREGQWADRSLFVTELLLSTLIANSDNSEDDLHDCHDAVTRGSDAFAAFGDMGCVEVMTLDVAVENLNLREQKNAQQPLAFPPL
ncbi:hypothetical protein J4Q44_G00160310 [Coregonus suidteri]|uniref:E3 ubiquitin-protein ligase KCMF1 n=1 Tax=Coregonus suidteri TaxID=861788 RepID=A0AAN8LN09_9TELE